MEPPFKISGGSQNLRVRSGPPALPCVDSPSLADAAFPGRCSDIQSALALLRFQPSNVQRDDPEWDRPFEMVEVAGNYLVVFKTPVIPLHCLSRRNLFSQFVSQFVSQVKPLITALGSIPNHASTSGKKSPAISSSENTRKMTQGFLSWFLDYQGSELVELVNVEIPLSLA